jgi:two-component system response regulator MprA
MKKKYRILLVDDDEDILWINQMILSEAGFSVDTCNNPEEALKKIMSQNFHIVILDYMMPKMKGDELAERILEFNKNVGIIFLTGYSEFVSYMKNVGGTQNLVLLKPVSEKELIDAVKLEIDILEVRSPRELAKWIS